MANFHKKRAGQRSKGAVDVNNLTATDQGKSKPKDCHQQMQILGEFKSEKLSRKYKETADRFQKEENISLAIHLYREAILLLIEERDDPKDQIKLIPISTQRANK